MPFGQKLNILDTTTRKAIVDVFSEPNFMKEVPATYGAGAIGTYMAPRHYRGALNNHIINEIHLDITGLAVVGTAQGDAIGLSAGGAAYIGRYVVATYGVVYRIELICLEVPGEATATITTDFDIMTMSANTTEYDGAVTTTTLASDGNSAAGTIYITNVPAMTANDYIYFGEGDTTAATGVYSAGQFIIRFFGHAAL